MILDIYIYIFCKYKFTHDRFLYSVATLRTKERLLSCERYVTTTWGSCLSHLTPLSPPLHSRLPFSFHPPLSFSHKHIHTQTHMHTHFPFLSCSHTRTRTHAHTYSGSLYAAEVLARVHFCLRCPSSCCPARIIIAAETTIAWQINTIPAAFVISYSIPLLGPVLLKVIFSSIPIAIVASAMRNAPRPKNLWKTRTSSRASAPTMERGIIKVRPSIYCRPYRPIVAKPNQLWAEYKLAIPISL
mmetsp:Transcript_19603/g.27365  ORF Transcript_19603/g.27365 Transcript_19603/m.27365 type:complete len:243 (+) Transcript_19603:41-769(+)